ncbi:MAG: 2-oxoglutarate dehydrogenase complex dihydrolipoyllysine-residue succinyltransferase [Flavobacteriales bacterium]
MILSMKVPSPGESISEVQIASWLKADGQYVYKDEDLVEVDSDKATLAIPAEASGILKITIAEGEVVKVGEEICTIDTSAKAPEGEAAAPVAAAAPVQKEAAAPAPSAAPAPTPAPQANAAAIPSPAAAKIMRENNLSPAQIPGNGKDGRITKQDVLAAMAKGFAPVPPTGSRSLERKKMSMLRKKVAERLVSVKNETAMLTTFNEVDMTAIMAMRSRHKEQFGKVHNIGLGFMSFFTKAVTQALEAFPAVNAMIDGDEIVYHNYCDVGIAVSTPKGLMVPVIRNAEDLSLAGIEQAIKDLAIKARDGKLSIDDMSGGTFTITNGGVFGSLMSTPIINPPQVAILGMHKIQDRPVAVNGKVEIRPMMYLALSYDHRIIDGKESVSFLVHVKESLENPERMLFGGKSPEEVLLGL